MDGAAVLRQEVRAEVVVPVEGRAPERRRVEGGLPVQDVFPGPCAPRPESKRSASWKVEVTV